MNPSCLSVVLALAAALAMPAARAVGLNDIRPDRIVPFVQADRVTVVLFTSPDEKCGYCVGQLNVFNKAAVGYRDEPPVFAYVQWKPWRNFPAMDLPRPIYGIPTVMIFRKGEVLAELGGRFTDPAQLTRLVDEVLAGKHAPLPHVAPVAPEAAASAPAPIPVMAAAASGAAPPALSERDRLAVMLFLRQELLTRVSRSCAGKHPSQAQAAERAEAAWNARHGQDAGRGMLIAMGAGSRADLRTLIDPLGKAQSEQLDAQLRIKPELAAADCEQVYAFMARDTGPKAAEASR